MNFDRYGIRCCCWCEDALSTRDLDLDPSLEQDEEAAAHEFGRSCEDGL